MRDDIYGVVKSGTFPLSYGNNDRLFFHFMSILSLDRIDTSSLLQGPSISHQVP